MSITLDLQGGKEGGGRGEQTAARAASQKPGDAITAQLREALGAAKKGESPYLGYGEHPTHARYHASISITSPRSPSHVSLARTSLVLPGWILLPKTMHLTGL